MKDKVMTAYKAFDKDWRCRGFQYKVGETYKHDGEISLCKEGFHTCNNPFDTLDYYPPIGKFAKVIVSNSITDASKNVSSKITIDIELSLSEFIMEGVDFLMSFIKKTIKNVNSQSPAVTNAYQSPAVTNDSRSPAVTNDSQSPAVTNDSRSPAVTNDSRSPAVTNDYKSPAVTNAYRSPAVTNASQSPAVTNAYRSPAVTNNSQSPAVTNAYRSPAVTNASQSPAEVSGKNSVAVAMYNSIVKACKGSAIVICYIDNDGNLKHIKSAMVGKKYTWGIIKPDTWYGLTSKGRFKEIK